MIVTGGTSVVNATLDDIDDNYNTTGEVSINDTAYDVAESGKIVTNYVSENKWSSNVSDGVSKIEALSKTNGNTVSLSWMTTTRLFLLTSPSMPLQK